MRRHNIVGGVQSDPTSEITQIENNNHTCVCHLYMCLLSRHICKLSGQKNEKFVSYFIYFLLLVRLLQLGTIFHNQAAVYSLLYARQSTDPYLLPEILFSILLMKIKKILNVYGFCLCSSLEFKIENINGQFFNGLLKWIMLDEPYAIRWRTLQKPKAFTFFSPFFFSIWVPHIGWYYFVDLFVGANLHNEIENDLNKHHIF